MIIITEFGGTAALAFLEDTIEIAEVVEPATVTYLCYRLCTIDELAAGIAQTEVDDVVAEVTPRMELEEAAEGRSTHASDICYLRQADLVAVVLVNVGSHLLHTAAVARNLHLRKAAGGQRTSLELREFVENRHELHKGIEAVLDRTERVDHRIDAHDSLHREGKALLRLDHHLLHRVEGIARKDAGMGKVDVELDGHFTDILTLAVVLLPDVFEVGTGDEHQVEVMG